MTFECQTHMKSKKTKDNSTKFVLLPFKFCICCGKSGDFNFHSFEYHQSSPIAQLGKFAGSGLDVITDYALTKTYTVEAFFCHKCGKRIKMVETIGQAAHLIFVLLIFATIISATIIDSYFGFENSLYAVAIGIMGTLGFRIGFKFYSWNSFPKIKSIDEKFVVLRIPGKGKLKHSRIVSS